jgi:2-polyprenyl-3-methyl-5-hydroxy-6-metoxy-1,4-benzoquinol methylase
MPNTEKNPGACFRIENPISIDCEAVEELRIEINWLIVEYKKRFGIDISNFIPGNCTQLVRYRCSTSGYRFYQPANIVGDSAFYEHLQKNEWYYMLDKWEFNEALNYIPADSEVKVLEIGSARGDFLNRLRVHNSAANIVGLELNEDAAAEASGRGLNVVVQSTSEHAQDNLSAYDVVVFFQVLEHISNPIEFLNDAISMLKTGGKLIICVPDNSQRAFNSIFVDAENILNMPPHHQGLWDIPSLAYLTKIQPLRLEAIVIEPAIYSHHSKSYRGLLKKDLVENYGKVLGMAMYAVARPFYNHALRHLNKYLPAHTVMAVYNKNNENTNVG